MDGELLALQWMEHSRIFSQAIGSLRGKAAYTDATLACEGHFFQVHKFVLSTCSEYFNDIFEWTPCVNPVVVLNNVSCKELEALLDFMYIGEVNVKETQIPDIMHAAECMRIRGLSMVDDDGVKTHLSKGPSDFDRPAKKRRRSDVRKRLPTASQKPLPPSSQTLPQPGAPMSHPQPPSAALQSPTEISLTPAGDTHNHASLPDHLNRQSPKPLQQHQATSVQDVSLPQPAHTPLLSHISQHSQLSVTQNHNNQNSIYLAPSQHDIPTDLSTREQPQEVNLPQSLTPIDNVIQEVKIELEEVGSEALVSHPEDGSVPIPDLLDSLVDMRPLYDGKVEQGEEMATFHDVDPDENLYDFTEEFPETSTSSQSDAQFSRGSTHTTTFVRLAHCSPEKLRPYKCLNCHRSFQKKESLTRHMLTHTKEPYRCTQCNYTCKTYRASLEHKREEHTKIFKCLVCDFTSKRQDNVKRHMRTHSNERPHKCPHCEFSSKHIQSLDKHIKKIHER
ncbi:broad-complex core protein isoforms 1/2/3/4/5 isoform X2 [Procambarus clarkii]|nr:zinc finger protein 236-like isoform X2 [Procambarus clarkii]XP_045602591.1 zinc finger protein 236-like isoform X2 [Procambarus clarkii]